MPRRSHVRLDDVADLRNLVSAFMLAARGKGGRREVRAFRGRLFEELSVLRNELLGGTLQLGYCRRFTIRDPKVRTIHAPVFRERVLHHALMAHVGPPLDRALVDDTYACRVGRGTIAAVHRAAQHAGAFPWCVKTDVRKYFDSVDHVLLKERLARHLKGMRVLQLLFQIVDAYESAPGKGLPIGALTSQHLANLYLAPLDRYLLQELRVGGMVRYMDDVVWWCRSREEARSTREAVVAFARDRLALEIKAPVRVIPARQGVLLCGFRVLPGVVLLSRRRRRRFASTRRSWEREYLAGRVDAAELQRGYAAAHGMLAYARSSGFRRAELRRRPPVEA